MKSKVYKLTNDRTKIEEVLDEAEKIAIYSGLSDKDSFKLRLLTEELFSILPGLITYIDGTFFIENNNGEFTLNIDASLNTDMTHDTEKLRALSTNLPKKEVPKGIMAKIRYAFEVMLTEYKDIAIPYSHYAMGLKTDIGIYSTAWSLNQYIEAAREKQDDSWSELETSIIAKIADEVIVGIKEDQVSIQVSKKF